MSLPSLFQRNLEIQGFKCNTPMFDAMSPWLRLNYVICLIGAVIGIILESPEAFFILAGIMAIGAFFPYGAGDLIYNYGIRGLLKTPAIPPTPPPRRFACIVGVLWALAIAFAFTFGYIIIAYVLGIMLIAVVIPIVAVHYCIASVLYQKFIGYHPDK